LKFKQTQLTMLTLHKDKAEQHRKNGIVTFSSSLVYCFTNIL